MIDLALKVDVDTHQGLERGVPCLLACLARQKAVASVYVSMGRDNSGKAVYKGATLGKIGMNRDRIGIRCM